MNKSQILILVLLIVAILFRIQTNGGLRGPQEDPELDKIASTFEEAREGLAKVSDQLLPQPQAALLSGMVLGVKSSLPRDFRQALSNTSTMHIVVVSGQNLTLLSGFILTLAPVFGRKKTVILSFTTVIFYAILTGLQIPVLRAALMVIFSSIAVLIGREGDSWWILFLTGGLMLLYNPNWLLSISFQLSFLATVGVVIVAPQIIKQVNFLPNIIKQDLIVSIAAQALTFPVIGANFHQGSISGIWVNALILWTVPIIMITGALVILSSLISLTLASVLALIPGIFLTYFVYIVKFFNQPWGSFYVNNTPWVVWAGYYLLIAGAYYWIRSLNQQKEAVDHES